MDQAEGACVLRAPPRIPQCNALVSVATKPTSRADCVTTERPSLNIQYAGSCKNTTSRYRTVLRRFASLCLYHRVSTGGFICGLLVVVIVFDLFSGRDLG